MLVYRVCSYTEIVRLLEEKSFENIGKDGKELIKLQQEKNINSHEYNFRNKYLHFFKDKSSIFYMHLENVFLCTYNIDDELLNSKEKEGYYLDLVNFRSIVSVPEYAIENSLLKFDNLEKVEYIDEFLDIDDYFVDHNLTESTKLIYQRYKSMSRERRKS